MWCVGEDDDRVREDKVKKEERVGMALGQVGASQGRPKPETRFSTVASNLTRDPNGFSISAPNPIRLGQGCPKPDPNDPIYLRKFKFNIAR